MLNFIFANLYIFVKNTIVSVLFVSALLFFIFEIVPLFFNKKNTIRHNLKEFLLYQIIRSAYTIIIGTFFTLLFIYLHLNVGFFNIMMLSTLSQVLILFFFSELVIYSAHLSVHKYRVPILSKAHAFHHTITYNMEWTNGRKEHYIILSLFTFIFCSFFFIIFKSSPLSHYIVIMLYLTLNSFSHYRVPVTIKFIDQIFLFPKDHLRHHTQRSGPYGVTSTLFDTIFGTRK